MTEPTLPSRMVMAEVQIEVVRDGASTWLESGITTFEDEFLAHILLPDGQTFGDWARPQVERAYAQGIMPASLLALTAPSD